MPSVVAILPLRATRWLLSVKIARGDGVYAAMLVLQVLHQCGVTCHHLQEKMSEIQNRPK
jgi:hypothetical protein